MAITRLTDFITVATSKWTYGDSAFKYEGEVNQDHDTIYPLMVMTPPSSRMPDIYEGWEHYNIEMEFYNSYQTAAQNAVTLQQRWDNLEDLALEWLDNILINYSGGVIVNPSTNKSPTPTQVYIDKESLRIERTKNDKNDKLCRITMNFDMRMFTRCFTPKSVYPNTINGCELWMKADSDVTFNIPTKKVSSWKGQDVNETIVSQSTIKQQPLRYGYDGAQDKAQIVFDGLGNFDSNANMQIGSDGEFSLFFVVRNTGLSIIGGYIFSAFRNDLENFRINLNTTDFSAEFTSSGNSINPDMALSTSSGEWAILYLQLKKNSPTNYSVILSENNSAEHNEAGTFQNTNWTDRPFQVGCSTSGVNTLYRPITGGISEIIGYDKAINSDEKSQVLNYLNNKYKIY